MMDASLQGVPGFGADTCMGAGDCGGDYAGDLGGDYGVAQVCDSSKILLHHTRRILVFYR